MSGQDLRAAETHFEFGKNWQSFISTVDKKSIDEAKSGLTKLFPNGEIKNARFLDVGCGSGLSMLAAKYLGAESVTGIDIDNDSVNASKALLSAHFPDGGWESNVRSVFDLSIEKEGCFDIVYSWGVLHHTGDMWPAIEKVSTAVKPGGLMAIALYRKTPFCRFWAIEKNLYTKSPSAIRALFRLAYKSIFIVGLIAKLRNPIHYIRAYHSNRGMDWHHDVHDWLGGYPYQSVLPEEVRSCFERIGFSLVRSFEKPAAAKGIFGSHCDEYVAIRNL